MGFAFLELVQQDDGEIILREGDESSLDERLVDGVDSAETATFDTAGSSQSNGHQTPKDPLVRIKFSQAILDMLDADAISLAEVMIEAATRALAEQDDDLDSGGDDDSVIRLQTAVLH